MASSAEAARSEPRSPAKGDELHERFYGLLVDEFAHERYPSYEMLNLMEAGMSEEDRRQIIDALLDKLANERYPSPALLRRVQRLIWAVRADKGARS